MLAFYRFLTHLSVVIALISLPAPVWAETSRYAAFVIDQDTGVVLHSRRSTAIRHPASLTKMMTLYLLFQALEEGDIGLQDNIRISATASRAAPSKLGLASGETITVENAIRALIIKSANDIAIAVSERLSGGQSRFAQHMTTRGIELGLTSTVFRNASGLPNSRQVTSARDMARLAVVLQRDFPQFMHYFEETSFRYNNVTYHNHNSLVGRVDGVTGLKTGYIRSSGFNVVVTAQRGEIRLVTVVMGGPSAAARDAHAEELLEAAFNSLEQHEDSYLFAAMSVPRINPIRQQDFIALDIEALYLTEPVEMGSAEFAAPIRIELGQETLTREISLESLPTNGNWGVQVGAYFSEGAANDRLDLVMNNSTALQYASQTTPSVDIDGKRLWRARFASMTVTQAHRACSDLNALNEPCYTVAPR